MAVTFFCPECGKQLRTANPIPPGKKVKCPACAAVFTPVVEPETVTAVQARLPSKGSLSSRHDAEDDRPSSRTHPDRGAAKKPVPRPIDEDEVEADEPRRRRRSLFDDVEDDLPRRKRRRDEEEDEDDYDDRPRKRKKGRKPANNLPLILGIAGGVALLLVVLALTAFVWPGFLLSPERGPVVANADRGQKGDLPPEKKGGMPGGKIDLHAEKQGGFPTKDKGGFPQPGGKQDQINLMNTVWSGSENLQGYGQLTFEFGVVNQVTMIDKDGRTPGTYQVAGNTVTIRFAKEGVTYEGTITGNAMTGTANNGMVNWQWNLKKR